MFNYFCLALVALCVILVCISPLIAKWFKLGDEGELGYGVDYEKRFTPYKKPVLETDVVQIEMSFEE